MKASCPSCGARFDLDCAVSDADGRRVAAILAELPAAVAAPMLHYLGLFRPESGGLRYGRMLTLLEELRPFILDGRVERAGRTWPAPSGFWAEALQHLASRPASLRLPLKSNGYLLEIVATMGQELAGKHERKQEEQLRHGYREGEVAAPRSSPQAVSDIIAKAKRQMGVS